MDGRPKRKYMAEFSNLSGVVRTEPKSGKHDVHVREQ